MPTTMKLIAKGVLGSSATQIDFTSIPGTYTDLLLVHSTRSDRSGNINDAVYVKFNTSTANFSVRFLEGTGSGVSSSTASVGFAGQATAATATSSTFSSNEVYIPNYAGSTNKSFSVTGVQETNSAGAYMDLIAGLWSNTAAITGITVYPSLGANFVSGSSAFLYGISRA